MVCASEQLLATLRHVSPGQHLSRAIIFSPLTASNTTVSSLFHVLGRGECYDQPGWHSNLVRLQQLNDTNGIACIVYLCTVNVEYPNMPCRCILITLSSTRWQSRASPVATVCLSHHYIVVLTKGQHDSVYCLASTTGCHRMNMHAEQSLLDLS